MVKASSKCRYRNFCCQPLWSQRRGWKYGSSGPSGKTPSWRNRIQINSPPLVVSLKTGLLYCLHLQLATGLLENLFGCFFFRASGAAVSGGSGVVCCSRALYGSVFDDSRGSRPGRRDVWSWCSLLCLLVHTEGKLQKKHSCSVFVFVVVM